MASLLNVGNNICFGSHTEVIRKRLCKKSNKKQTGAVLKVILQIINVYGFEFILQLPFFSSKCRTTWKFVPHFVLRFRHVIADIRIILLCDFHHYILQNIRMNGKIQC